MVADVNALLANAGRLATNSDSSRVADITRGGQLGLGSHLDLIDAATPCAFMPVIPIVMSTPTLFNGLPGFNAAFKALVERHSKAITGIDVRYDLDTDDSQPAGNDGQKILTPTRTTRIQPQPEFTWGELNGNLVWNLIKTWIVWINDPDTQASRIGQTAATGGASSSLPLVMSTIGADVLFIQPDKTMHPDNILDAWIITGMYPKTTGDAGYKKTIGETTIPERQIQFTGILQHNDRTRIVGRNILKAMQAHTVNYDLSTPVTQSINSALNNLGLQKEVADAITAFQRTTG